MYYRVELLECRTDAEAPFEPQDFATLHDALDYARYFVEMDLSYYGIADVYSVSEVDVHGNDVIVATLGMENVPEQHVNVSNTASNSEEWENIITDEDLPF